MIYLISILALIVVFTIATIRPINMGLLALLAAFVIGPVVSGISAEDVMTFFPADMFIMVLGITLLFGLAHVNGTLETIMYASLRLVRGQRWAIAWAMFVLSALLMSLGAVLAVSMLAPIAMPIAKRYRINPLLMSAMLGHGAFGAAFSPITVYSVGIQQILGDFGLTVNPLLLFSVPFALNLALALGAFFVLGRDMFGQRGRALHQELAVEFANDSAGTADVSGGGGALAPREPVGSGSGTRPGPGSGGGTLAQSVAAPPEEAVVVEAAGTHRLNWEQGLTLLSIAALLGCALFGVDVGVASLIIAVVLLIILPSRVQDSMKQVAWPAALLVCGVVTYMGVLSANGTIEHMGELASNMPSALLTALVLLFAIGLISAVGSSFGIILIALPLVAPLMASGQLAAVPLVLAICFCATVVDVSPFSTNGVIVLSTAQVDDKLAFQRKMLTYCGYICVVAPLLAWALLILPSA